MLVIRPAQMEAFTEARLRDLRVRIAWHIRRAHPDAIRGLGDEELERRVRLGCRRAARWKFQRESSIATFVTLMFIVAPDFDRHAPVRRILEDQRLPIDQRPLLLAHEVTARQWEEMRAAAPESAWQELGRQESGQKEHEGGRVR